MESTNINSTFAVTLYTEANPNPNSMKFVANFMLVPERISYDFPSKAEASSSPLALQLFEKPYVERVFFMSNFVTVTKTDSADWAEVNEALKGIIKNYLESENPVIDEDQPAGMAGEGDSETVKKIKDILDEYIRPAVEQDGGAITFHSFEGGLLKVLLQGSCSGCPSSVVTLKAGIENLMKRMVPEVEAVEAENA